MLNLKRREIVIGLIMMLPTTSQIAMATIDSNSVIRDGIEYYIQTDKSVYNLGENVEMLYRVTNMKNESVTFDFPVSPEWNFWAEKDGDNIWKAVNGWWMAGTSFTLASGEYKEFPNSNIPCIWNMRDNENNLIGLGEYKITGGFDAFAIDNRYDYSKISVPINIIPEPATLILLGLGFTQTIRRKRTKPTSYATRESI